jgi:hypothetical protein
MYLKNWSTPAPIQAKVTAVADGAPIMTGVVAFHVVGSTRVAVAGTAAAHVANGLWTYTPTQAETNYSQFSIEFYHADAVADGPVVEVVTWDAAQAQASAAAAIAAGDLATSAQAAAIAAMTGLIPADPATVAKQDEILEAIGEIEGGSGSGASAEDLWTYARRTLTMSPAAVQALLVESTLTIRRGDSIEVEIPLSQDPSTATAVVFTAKRHPVGDADTAAIIQVTVAGGLTRLNGLAVDDAALGSLTTSGTTATLTIHGEATAALTVKTGLYWDVQIIDADGDPVTIAEGRLNVTADVTRATE